LPVAGLDAQRGEFGDVKLFEDVASKKNMSNQIPIVELSISLLEY